jgi:hypothetical protein
VRAYRHIAFPIAMFAIMMFGMSRWYASRCADIGGEWHPLKGCKVRINGGVHWIARP